MGRPWIVLFAVCAAQLTLSAVVEYEVTADTAVMQSITGLTPSTPTSGFGVKLSGSSKSKRFAIAVPINEFYMEVVIPEAAVGMRYLNVFIINPTTQVRDACKVKYQLVSASILIGYIVRPRGADANGKLVDYVTERNAFVAKFVVKSDGEAGIMPYEKEKTCTYPPYNNAPDYGDKKMIQIEFEATDFPPNSEVNFPADVDFLAPKAPTTTTTTTTAMTTEASKPTESEDAPGDEDDEDSTAAVAKASAGKIVAIVIPIVLVVIVLLAICILGFVGYLKRDRLMAWYTERKNRGKSTKKDTPGTTGASEDQQDASRSVMPTTTERSTVNATAKHKSAKQKTSERQKPTEDTSEQSKATVKQTSAEPSTKKVEPVKPTSAEPPIKKKDPREGQYDFITPPANQEQPPAKVNTPNEQHGTVNNQQPQQPPAKVNTPNEQHGTVNNQQPPQPPAKVNTPNEQYGTVNNQQPPQPPAKVNSPNHYEVILNVTPVSPPRDGKSAKAKK